ncbi:MAG: hypothetical protein ABJA79_08145, partial [Parafilimonas sp.]
FFRAKTISDAFSYIKHIFQKSIFSSPRFNEIEGAEFYLPFFILVMIVMEWLNRSKPHALQLGETPFPRYVQWGYYFTILWAILWYGAAQQGFIYFQF